jgi:hypothetical protein
MFSRYIEILEIVFANIIVMRILSSLHFFISFQKKKNDIIHELVIFNYEWLYCLIFITLGLVYRIVRREIDYSANGFAFRSRSCIQARTSSFTRPFVSSWMSSWDIFGIIWSALSSLEIESKKFSVCRTLHTQSEFPCTTNKGNWNRLLFSFRPRIPFSKLFTVVKLINGFKYNKNSILFYNTFRLEARN